jgi:transposase InsO family protein
VTLRSINRHLQRFLETGPAGLYDGRRSNYRKVDGAAEQLIVQAKRDGPHRSARFIRDLLRLSIHAETVRQVLVKHHLERVSQPPVKPIRRFQAAAPNDLGQIDIQGKISFPLLGDLLLILVKDDHSRFLLAGRWFFHQYKINVFMVLHAAFRQWGLPRGLLSDRGSQFKAQQLHGETEYQYLARRLGIEFHYGRRARTKGKRENTFRFAQRDFVLENLHQPSLAALNTAWATWMAWYN